MAGLVFPPSPHYHYFLSLTEADPSGVVCDWYHLQPQLFHLTQKLGSLSYWPSGPRVEVPKFCEVVDLVVEYIKKG